VRAVYTVNTPGKTAGERRSAMVAVLVVLLLIAVLFGGGFAYSLLWFIALAVLILWLVGFAVRPGGRWYYW
jgi:hypothetical protein